MGSMIADKFAAWESECENRFQTLKRNEEELNRIFIDIYGLQDELTPEVDDKDVTVRRADLGREIRSLISYAVGCMFGRYSLDVEGLAYAGGAWDAGKYRTFQPDKDGILPITDEEYFDDDIVSRFVAFIKTVYGADTLEENLYFIAETLYPTGDAPPRAKIRRYFMNDFYKDHVRIYKKRPIYWLLDSGKEGGFRALIYLHRYHKHTIGLTRADYMHPLQRMYDAEIERLQTLQTFADAPAKEKSEARKRVEVLRRKIVELRAYDPVVSHLAQMEIVLDLDDGVAVNYAKFQDVEVTLLDGRTAKMNLLAVI